MQHLLPGRTVWRGEVTINAFHGRFAESRDFRKNPFNNGRLGIVGVYENSKVQSPFFGFDFGDNSGRYHHVARKVYGGSSIMHIRRL
ncbi:hypothetical protein CBM2592_A190011 [Cupriavidus taiwanensis]|nr:hypothetical protein CBM2592_A190011 [Cupriavidus taiwanensis]SOY83035.1 hypothetical protein CBM2591_A230013 [Cupriavidus taiwanensis]SOZ56211.1 hypothetical protein CBM2617_A200019 [Cupriavidus taiwanensis]SOZ78804.1 hypothetical protein CBM2618_A180019 [Cupriavidus taiwanensis]SOZ79076.1 hypothetical protein CBM2622_A170018 [Cupriavidus taiwanensis]